MDGIERFAAQASEFRDWARDGIGAGHVGARKALEQITQLYVAGLALPQPWSSGCSEDHDAYEVPAEELRTVVTSCVGLPFDFYWEVIDPLETPAENGVGSLSDDIGDIYRDVVSGLVEFEAGRSAEAQWEWSFNFESHWGEHATSAMRALHWWLSESGFHPEE